MVVVINIPSTFKNYEGMVRALDLDANTHNNYVLNKQTLRIIMSQNK